MPQWLRDTGEYLAVIKDIANIVAAGIASFVAVTGLTTWKRQLKGNAEYQLARRLLKSVYALRDAIALVRNPFQSAGEIAQALREANINVDYRDKGFQVLSAQAVYQHRWNRVVEASSALQVDGLEAEALWGPVIQEHLRALSALVSELSFSIQMYLRNLERPPRDQTSDQMRAIDAVIYEVPGSEHANAFSKKLAAAISNIESFIQPKLKF